MSPSKSAAPVSPEPPKKSWLPGLALLVMVFATYFPVMSADFIWDDDDYVTENEQLRTPEGLYNIWFDIGATPQYYPLVHSTFWMEYQLWELDPAGYHFNNVLLHALAAFLLWLVLKRLSVPGAWFAAALFAIHPVEVESVAWVTERKNVLSGFMYMASALMYFRFTGADGEGERSWKHYGFALLFFVGALLSKTVTASLPGAILVVLWWKRGSLRVRDFLPLVPFFVIGSSLGWMTAQLEVTQVGAEGADWSLTYLERFMVAGRISLFYVTKIIWPEPLAFFYERWDVSQAAVLQYFFPLAVIAILGATWYFRDRIGRGALACFLFLGGTLFPALGFLDVYPMRFSYVADHFQYLAGIGVFVLIGAAFQRVATTKHIGSIQNAGIALVYIVFCAITVNQIGSYQDLETLWRDTMRKNPKAWVAHNNLGIILNDRGDLVEAEARYREAIRLLPTFVDARNNLGGMLSEQGKHEEAIELYETALELKDDHFLVMINLAAAYTQVGRYEDALAMANKAIAANIAKAEEFGQPVRVPFDFYYKRGVIYWSMRRAEEAGADFDRVIAEVPNHDKALTARGRVSAALGRGDEAIEYFERALEVVPNHEGPLSGICLVLMQRKDHEAARVRLKQLKHYYPEHPIALNGLRQLGEE